MPNLLDIILALDDEDRRALSAIWIERGSAGIWQARCSIARQQYGERAHTCPPGVGLTAWVRVPDQIYPLDLDEIERDRHMRAQALAVQQSGIVGMLDLARYDRADRETRYLIKTHAGTQKERTQWLMRLNERPENTIYSSEAES